MLILLLVAQTLAHSEGKPDGSEMWTYILSDTSNLVVGPYHRNGGQAVRTWDKHSGWTASIPGATWIWDSYEVTAPNTQQTSVFTNHFFVDGSLKSALLELAADNSVWVKINFKDTNCYKENGSYDRNSQFSCDVTSYLVEGLNEIKFTVVNLAGGGHYTANPAGLLYKLTIKTVV